jgi:Protein of unknown function (DUF5672)
VNVNQHLLTLREVALVCCDTRDAFGAIRSLGRSLSRVCFGDCVLVTSAVALSALPGDLDLPKGVRLHVIPPLDGIGDYSKYVLSDLRHVTKMPFVLLSQWDSWILSAEDWTADFLKYDYIGAVWPHHADRRVGNGGFSLRSRRLMAAVDEVTSRTRIDESTIEDDLICRTLREELERRHACVFADEAIADKFSSERRGWESTSFGFHGLFNFGRIFDSSRLIPELSLLVDDNFRDRASFDLALFLLKENRTLEAKYVLNRRTKVAGWTTKNMKLALRLFMVWFSQSFGALCLGRSADARSPQRVKRK